MSRTAATVPPQDPDPRRDAAVRPTVSLDFGGVVVRVDSADPGLAAGLGDRFPRFVTSENPAFQLHHVPRRQFREAAAEGGGPSAGRSGVRLDTASYAAVLDPASGHGWVTGRIRPGTVVNLVRFLLPLLLRGGVVFHAAALADRDRGFLLAGRSGTGKSTLSRMYPDHVLGEEVAVVATSVEGLRLHGSPHRLGRAGSADLSGVFLLARGHDGHQRVRLDRVTALRRLTALAFWPTGHGPEMVRTLDTLTRIVESVPVWELRFSLPPDVWVCMTAPPEAA